MLPTADFERRLNAVAVTNPASGARFNNTDLVQVDPCADSFPLQCHHLPPIDAEQQLEVFSITERRIQSLVSRQRMRDVGMNRYPDFIENGGAAAGFRQPEEID